MDSPTPGCQLLRTRDLLSLLFAVAPEVAHDPNLLERSVLLTGVTSHTTPTDLLDLFPLKTDAADIVRDFETGERAGLVVLGDAGDCDEATKKTEPPVAFYRECIKAGDSPQLPGVLVRAVWDRHHTWRIPTTGLLRSLLPPVYIEQDSSIHLRCVFLRGAYNVSSLDAALPWKGGVCAVIACKVQSAAVLVYDDAYSAEEVSRTLVRSRSLKIYDSAMFPVRDTAGSAPGDQLQGMIPSAFTKPEYSGRIVLFQGLDTEHWDAPDVARCINIGLEALVVHRSRGLVVALFSSKEDARLQLNETPETWDSIFGLPLTSELVDDAQLFGAQDQGELAEDDEEELAAPAGRPYPDVHQDAIMLHYLLDDDSEKCALDDIAGIAKMLIKRAVFSRPDALRRKGYPDRAVLLLGIHPARSYHIWEALSRYGPLDDLCLSSRACAGLAVFKKRNAAFKLLQEPIQSCLGIGFHNCQRVPGAEHAAQIADEMCASLFDLDAQLKKLRCTRCDNSGLCCCSV